MSPKQTRVAAQLAVLLLLAGLGGWFWIHRSNRDHSPTVAPEHGAPTGEKAQLESPVTRPEAREEVAVEPSPPNQVRIRVTNFTTHEPIANASLEFVTLDEALEGKHFTTDANGMVMCTAESLVGARVTVTADGYCPINQLVPDSKGAPIDIQLCLAGSIRVRVLDERRAPALAALVVASLPVEGVPEDLRAGLSAEWPNFYGVAGTSIRPALTDDAGERVLEGMPCGIPMRVTASRAIPETSVDTRIDPTLRHAEVEIAATSTCCLHGRLVWDDGTPVRWISWEASGDPVRVSCLDGTDSPNGPPQAQAGSNGEFQLCDLRPGRVNWRVDWPGEPARSTLVSAPVVEVGEIVLRKAVLCEGRVFLTNPPKDFSYSGIFLVFSQNGRVVQRVGPVQADGGFRARLPIGPLQIDVTVTNQDHLGTVTREIPAADLAICLDPFVGRLRITNLDLDPRLSPYLRLEDTRGESPGKWNGSRVAHQYSLLGTESIIGWKGHDLCAWFLSPGSYDVYVGVQNDQRLACAGRATIAAGEECVLDASKNGRGRIRGVVQTPDGTAVGGTSIMGCPRALTGSRRYRPPVAVTNEHGEFEFSPVGAGTWCIFPCSRGPDASEARSVEVVPGSEVRVTLTMQVPGRVEGIVRRHGKPAKGALIVIRSDCDRYWVHKPDSQRLNVEQDGQFHFEDLAPGRYELRAYSGEIGQPGFRNISNNIVVEAAKTSKCDIALDFALTPLLVTREGQPLAPILKGYVAGPGGYHALELAGDPPCWGARPMDGPCLFLFLQEESFWEQSWSLAPTSYLVAYVPGGIPGAQELRIDVHGASLVVRPRTAETALPRASLEGVGGLTDLSQFFWFPIPLASIDDGTSRRFPCIPPGSTVLLESDRSLVGPMFTKRVSMGSQAELEILWPPE